MAINMGTLDRTLRLVGAGLIALLELSGRLSVPLAVALAIVGTIFVITSLTGRCPTYLLFGISTGRGATPANSHIWRRTWNTRPTSR